MGDDVVPGLKDLIPNLGRDARDWGRQQLQNGRQELRSAAAGAENDLFNLFGLQRDGKTISGNIAGVDVTKTGSDWKVEVDDFSLAKSRSGVNLRFGNWLLAESPSGWSIKVGESVDLRHSTSETKSQFNDPFSEALFKFDKTRQGIDVEGKQIDGMSFHVQRGATGDSIHVESDGVVFDIKKAGGKVSAGVTSPVDNTGTIFSADPVTKTLSIFDVESGTTLSIQKTGLRTFRVEESQLPRFNFKPSALLDGVHPQFLLPNLRLGTDLFDGSGHLNLSVDPANINLNATNEFGPLKATVDANQNYWLPNAFTKQGRSHPFNAIFGKNNLDVSATFDDRFGVGFTSDGQNPTLRVLRSLDPNAAFGAEYNFHTRHGTINFMKRFDNGPIIRINAGPGNVGAEIRFER
jgi:hypothetical protein